MDNFISHYEISNFQKKKTPKGRKHTQKLLLFKLCLKTSISPKKKTFASGQE